MPLWQIDIYTAEDQLDREADRTAEEIAELGLGDNITVAYARGFLVDGDFAREDAARLAEMLLCDSVTERSVVAIAGQEILNQPPTPSRPHSDSQAQGDTLTQESEPTLVNVLPKPGVMDPVARSAEVAARVKAVPFNVKGADASHRMAPSG